MLEHLPAISKTRADSTGVKTGVDQKNSDSTTTSAISGGNSKSNYDAIANPTAPRPKQVEHLHDHSHEGQAHQHIEVGDGKVSFRLKLGLILTVLFVIGEFVAGLWSNSLALVSDAGHNLTDALALGFSLWALTIARRAPNYNKTYGYHRAGILAAIINATTLVVIACYIFYEGVQRLLKPEPVQGWLMAGVAVIALLLNGVIALGLHSHAHSDLNVRSAFVHMLGDALSSVGVIVAGVGIALTGWLALDPLISVLIGLFILWSSWGVIKEATNILLEASPQGLDMAGLLDDLRQQPNVREVHDLHVWNISNDFRALSCHVLTTNCTMEEATLTVQKLNQLLESRYEIHHATLQLEYQGCQNQDVYCDMGKKDSCCED